MLERSLRSPNKAPVVAVLDGQGGGIGAAVIKEIRREFQETVEIWALGANSSATEAMLRARANRGATGENAIRVSLARADALVAPIAAGWANAMMGEITPGIAEAVMSADILKIFIPLSLERVVLAGHVSEPLPHLVAKAVEILKASR
jgi:threonine/homoserine efflux transporter RhtA